MEESHCGRRIVVMEVQSVSDWVHPIDSFAWDAANYPQPHCAYNASKLAFLFITFGPNSSISFGFRQGGEYLIGLSSE